MKYMVRALLVIWLVLMLLMPSLPQGAQTTDRSAVDDWLKMSENRATCRSAPKSPCRTGSSTSSSCLWE